MEHNLVWGALGIGCLGWLCTLLLSQPRGGAIIPVSTVRRSFLGLAVFLPFAIWVLTLPTSPPFSAGQGWGRGFLLGGLGCLASTFVILRATAKPRSGSAASSSLFAALVITCVPLLWMRHAVIEVLVGAALGWIVTSLILLFGLESKDEIENGVSTLLLNGAAYATALCGVAALGVYRDFVVTSASRGTYSAVAVALAATIGLTLLFGAFIGEAGSGDQPIAVAKNAPLSSIIAIALNLILPLGMAYLLAMKLLDDLGLIYVVATGLALGLALWFLVWDDASKQSATRGSVPPAALVVALCAFMLSYQVMQGFGVGLMLLAAWPVSLLALPSSNGPGEIEKNIALRHQVAQTLSVLLSFVAILLLSRLFATRFRADLRGATLADQYALFGFLAGAILPALLASQRFSSQPYGEGISANATPVPASLARLFCIGILTIALPGAMLALWGVKVVPAFFAGLGLAVAGFYPALVHRRQRGSVALFALAIATTSTQWAHRFAPFAEVSRAARLHFLLWTMGSLILIVLVVEYGARIAQWMRRRNDVQAQGASR